MQVITLGGQDCPRSQERDLWQNCCAAAQVLDLCAKKRYAYETKNELTRFRHTLLETVAFGMNYLRAQAVRLLTEYFGSDDRRIDHALRVLFHAEALLGKYPGCDEEIVIATALLHDVGIKVSEEKHGYNNGQTQEEYGPAVAEALLQGIGFPADKLEVVKQIIGNHHSPARYDYPELALLKEADRIVNRESP